MQSPQPMQHIFITNTCQLKEAGQQKYTVQKSQKKDLSHNVSLTTAFTQRLSHNIFRPRFFSQRLSQYYFLTTSLSQRLSHTVVLTQRTDGRTDRRTRLGIAIALS